MGVLVLDAPVRGAPAGKFAGLIGGDPLSSGVKKCAESTLQWQSAIIGLSYEFGYGQAAAGVDSTGGGRHLCGCKGIGKVELARAGIQPQSSDFPTISRVWLSRFGVP